MVAQTMSPFSGVQQIQAHPGQWFEMEVELPPLQRDIAEEWSSFFLSLNGIQGTFLIGDPSANVPRGIAATNAGAPKLNGAHNARATTISLKGLPINITNYLKKGDYIQLGSGLSARLHKVLNDVSSNASGIASADIFPSLRTSYADNTAVVVSYAKGLFRLASNDMNFDISEALIYSTSFKCREAL
ncbi:MAG: hypothetical protein SFT90_01805 [Rickettsiales bacterium]|nr:hypothetical protein [Rickettsiales bacterium]